MKEPRHDDERLAALLEGRLEGPERDELLAYLATADEDLHVFAKTAAALREMEEEEAAQAQQAREQVDHPPAREPLPPSTRSGWHRWKAPRVIVPAVLAGLVVLAIFLTRGGGTSAGDPIQLAGTLGRPLPGDWDSTRPWNPVRGGGSSGETGQAVRAGALLVDLALAIQEQDAEATRTLASSVHRRFDRRATPSSAIRQIEERAGAPPSELLPLLEQATQRLALDRDHLGLGAWGEAALLAAHYGDTEFFRSDATRTMLDKAERLTRGDPPAREAVARIRAAVDAEGTLDAPTLARLVADLMNAIAS